MLQTSSRPVHPSRGTTRPARFLSSSSPHRARYERFNVDPEHPFDMRKWDRTTQVFAVVVVGGGVYYLSHLEQVPETGRWRFMDVNPKYETKLAKIAYEETLQEFKGRTLPENHPLTRHVRRVVNRILESNNLGVLRGSEPGLIPPASVTDDLWAPQLPPEDVLPGAGGREWNLLVVNDDKVVNAAATFGNIIVFTGILPVAKDEQGLAAILGHVARHNSERYSSMKVLLALATLLEVVGLDAFFRACYDPRSSPEMFARLAKLEGRGGLNLNFLRTHPASDMRIKALQDMLPEAYTIQAASPSCGETSDSLAAFRDTFTQAQWADGRDGAIRRWS
ncbi:hypothetical protein B0H21DRAFT_781031 [Amylocystis lapponica]|nr:hypothetical protein B0H21DRAFT_781031 [Amylocystis lapponica]